MSNFEIVQLTPNETFILHKELNKFINSYNHIKINFDFACERLRQYADKGVVLAALDGFEVGGFIVGTYTQTPWSLDNVLVELAWWVNEDHRQSSVGLRLLKEFEKYNPGKVAMSLLPTSNIKESSMAKLGYKQVEHAYLKECA